MWDLKGMKWPIGTVSMCLKYNNVVKFIEYVSDVDMVV